MKNVSIRGTIPSPLVSNEPKNTTGAIALVVVGSTKPAVRQEQCATIAARCATGLHGGHANKERQVVGMVTTITGFGYGRHRNEVPRMQTRGIQDD